jgi:hypothetical protein
LVNGLGGPRCPRQARLSGDDEEMLDRLGVGVAEGHGTTFRAEPDDLDDLAELTCQRTGAAEITKMDGCRLLQLGRAPTVALFYEALKKL